MLAEFILRVHEDESALCGDFRAAAEEGEGVFLEHFVLFGSGESACKDFFLGYVGIVFTDFGFGGGGDDGLGETLVLLHALGEFHTAYFAHTALVGTPGASAEIAAHNHFHGETFTHHAHGDHGVGSGKLPVGTDVGGGIEELGGNLVEDLSFEGNAFGEDHVES